MPAVGLITLRILLLMCAHCPAGARAPGLSTRVMDGLMRWPARAWPGWRTWWLVDHGAQACTQC